MMVRLLPVALLALLALSAHAGRAAARPVLGVTAAQGRGVSTPVVRPAPVPDVNVRVARAAVIRDVWDVLADCESDGDWQANTGNGFYGGLQFTLSSWRWVGGAGMPHEASRREQIARARELLSRQGWSAWTACSRQLGLRGAS